MTEEIQVQAIRDRDLHSILERYEMFDSMEHGNLTCTSCTTVLTWENLGAILVKGGSLVLCCTLSECIDAVANEVTEVEA